MLNLIAAASTFRVIGAEGGIPWFQEADKAFFEGMIEGKPLIMGRKTLQSHVRKLGHPRPNSIVISRSIGALEGATIAHTPFQALVAALKLGEEVFVLGGEAIFQMFLPIADRLYLTHIHTDKRGDAHFPYFNKEDWTAEREEMFPPDEWNEFAYTFYTYTRPS